MSNFKLNKKDTEKFNSEKCVIQDFSNGPIGTKQLFHVHLSLTRGELLALKNKLEDNPTMVGSDVRDYVNNALETAGVRFLI